MYAIAIHACIIESAQIPKVEMKMIKKSVQSNSCDRKKNQLVYDARHSAGKQAISSRANPNPNPDLFLSDTRRWE
jgi:hypothetical protein